MSPTAQLDAKRQQAEDIFDKAKAALRQGRISLQEHDALLNAYFGTTSRSVALDRIGMGPQPQGVVKEEAPKETSGQHEQATAQEMGTATQRTEKTATPGTNAPSSFIARASESVRHGAQQATDKARQGMENAKVTLVIVGFAAIVLSLFVALFYSTGGITGAVVLNTETNISTTYIANATLPIELVNMTRMNVTGLAQGAGNVIITLDEDGQEHLLYNYTNGPVATAHASLPASWYEEGTPITYLASNVTGAYLMNRTEASPLGENTTITGLTPGDYAIKLIINDTTLSQETLAFHVVAQGTPAPSDAFNACGDLCVADISANATLNITIDGPATLRLDDILIAHGNSPPLLVTDIPDIAGVGTVRVDIGGAFMDPDGDPLAFDTTLHEGLNETMENSTLVVTGPPGSYTYIVYASDGQAITPSNIFSVTLSAPPNGSLSQNATPQQNGTEQNGTMNATGNLSSNAQNESNGTGAAPGNATAPETAPATGLTNATDQTGNATIALNNTGNQTATPAGEAGNETANTTLNTTLDCSNPDPNQRPLECLQENASRYFNEPDKYWEDLSRQPVAKFNALGNMLITGGVIERSGGAPGPTDFALGYRDADSNFVPTIWIDAQGNLRLKGTLHEEELQLSPPQGDYTIITSRSIYLMYVDTTAGDVYLRGNLIPYRRSLG